jgi:hypothetical protein
MDPDSPSPVSQLSDELILLIISHLQDISPRSVIALASVSSFFYSKARYMQHRDVTVNLLKKGEYSDVRYFEYILSTGMLPAIRTLRVIDTYPEDRQFPALLVDMIPRMTGLSDFHWTSHTRPIPVILLERLSRRTRLHTQLHTTADGGVNEAVALDYISGLTASPNLYSLGVQYFSTSREKCLKITQPIGELVLSCPNLRRLALNILPWRPVQDGDGNGLGSKYLALGLLDGQRFPPLEALELYRYPWGGDPDPWLDDSDPWHGDAATGGSDKRHTEMTHWAENLDWSQLRRLSTSDERFAQEIMPKLTALKEFDMACWSNREEKVRLEKFLQNVPSALEDISLRRCKPIYPDVISRHGATLRKLQIHNQSIWKGGPERQEYILSDVSLSQLRDGLPQLEELVLDLSKDNNDWPYKKLDILAGFQRLMRLTLWFELDVSKGDLPAPPHLTMTSADRLFRYLREHSSGNIVSPQWLRICSGSPSSVDMTRSRYQPSLAAPGSASWPLINSTSFVCKVVPQSQWPEGEESKDGISVTCAKLSDDLNDKIHRAAKGEQMPLSAGLGVDFMVALDGPIPLSQWKAMCDEYRREQVQGGISTT